MSVKHSSYPGLNQYIAMKVMFNSFGCEFFEMPDLNEKMLRAGEAHTPEYACLPVKVYYGFFKELIDQGVNDIFVYGATDIRCCRYMDLFEGPKKILNDQGHNFKVHYWGGFGGIPQVFQQIRDVAGKQSSLKIVMGIMLYSNALYVADILNDEANRIRPYEAVSGSADAWLKHWQNELKNQKAIFKLFVLKNKALKEAKKIQLDKSRKPVRVAIAGDMFKIHEPFFHFDTIRKINKLGLISNQPISFSLLFLGQNPIPFMGAFKKRFKNYQAKAQKYLASVPASYLDVAIGEIIEELENGAKGIIHFQSFGCMPDILLKPILDRIAVDYGVPIMHFMRDTHSSDAAYQTRLEAFADLIKKKNSK